MLLPLILFLTVSFPIAWFVSEFQGRTWLRLLLGSAAISMSFLVAAAVGMLERFNSNAWYGFASQELIETTLKALKAGDTAAAIDNLSWLHETLQPTYENRANYDALVAKYVKRFEPNKE